MAENPNQRRPSRGLHLAASLPPVLEYSAETNERRRKKGPRGAGGMVGIPSAGGDDHQTEHLLEMVRTISVAPWALICTPRRKISYNMEVQCAYNMKSKRCRIRKNDRNDTPHDA